MDHSKCLQLKDLTVDFLVCKISQMEDDPEVVWELIDRHFGQGFFQDQVGAASADMYSEYKELKEKAAAAELEETAEEVSARLQREFKKTTESLAEAHAAEIRELQEQIKQKEKAIAQRDRAIEQFKESLDNAIPLGLAMKEEPPTPRKEE